MKCSKCHANVPTEQMFAHRCGATISVREFESTDAMREYYKSRGIELRIDAPAICTYCGTELARMRYRNCCAKGRAQDQSQS